MSRMILVLRAMRNVIRVKELVTPLSNRVSWMQVSVWYASVEGVSSRQFEGGVMLLLKFVILLSIVFPNVTFYLAEIELQRSP